MNVASKKLKSKFTSYTHKIYFIAKYLVSWILMKVSIQERNTPPSNWEFTFFI